MIIEVHPSEIAGSVPANPSKSYTQRAYAMAALAHGRSVISHPSESDDAKAALTITQNLGARIKRIGESVRIDPAKSKQHDIWNAGESGLAFRMFSAIAALQERTIILNAERSLRQRPASFIANTLREMGVHAGLEDGKPPLRIAGPLKSGSYVIDGSTSSQFLTGLLISLPLCSGDSILRVDNLKSKPYIDMTLAMMEKFGVHVDWEDHARFRIQGGQNYRGTKVLIEGDWSGAAFLLVAGAIAGRVRVLNLELQSIQADTAILPVLEITGAEVTKGKGLVEVSRPQTKLRAFAFDATHCPDLFPPLAVLAAHCDGHSTITGVHRLAHKESNRFETLKGELGKLGVPVLQEGDKMHIDGVKVRGGKTVAHGDHRVAMALACAALQADSTVVIDGAECVAKSYPGFFQHLKSLKVKVLESKT